MKAIKIACLCLLLSIIPAVGYSGLPAVRVGDATDHGGVIIGPGTPTVLIEGMPAARMGDWVSCPLTNGYVSHVGGTISTGSATVLINGMPAARMGDVVPETGSSSTIIIGSPTVLIGG